MVALHKLAADCQIPADYLSRGLALQIVSRCCLVKARERMLVTHINLDQYLKILKSDEVVI